MFNSNNDVLTDNAWLKYCIVVNDTYVWAMLSDVNEGWVKGWRLE